MGSLLAHATPFQLYSCKSGLYCLCNPAEEKQTLMEITHEITIEIQNTIDSFLKADIT